MITHAFERLLRFSQWEMVADQLFETRRLDCQDVDRDRVDIGVAKATVQGQFFLNERQEGAGSLVAALPRLAA